MPRCSRRYGDVVRLRFPGPLVYLPGHPNRIEYVLVKESMRPCSPAPGASAASPYASASSGATAFPLRRGRSWANGCAPGPRLFEYPEAFPIAAEMTPIDGYRDTPDFVFGGPPPRIARSFAGMGAVLLLATIARRPGSGW